MEKEKAKIGIALGGGGLRGLAHIGVLEFMEEENVPVDAIAGTSMGGIIAGLYAAGVPITKLKEIGTKTGILDFATPDPNRHGLIGHSKMQQFFADLLGSETITFADLKTPTAMIAADLETGEMVILNEGPLIPAMMATSAFPIVFSPVYHKDRWLVDGGVLNNLPIDIVRAMGVDRVIGVNTPPSLHKLLSVPKEHEKRPRLSPHSILSLIARPGDWKTPMLIAENSVAFTADIVNEQRLKTCPPDLLLHVSIPNTGTFVADDSLKIIQSGYQTAKEETQQFQMLRETPKPTAWRRGWNETIQKLKHAWEAYKAPTHTLFPPSEEIH